MRFAPAPEPPLNPTPPSEIVQVPMRDGVKLYTELFIPQSDTVGVQSSERYPVVLLRSPYPYTRPSRNDRLSIVDYLAAGFAVAFQLTRGQGESEGVFHFFQDDLDDGYDAIQWLACQSWCNGNVGMQGASYLGNTQLLAAKRKPPALKCIMPTAFIGSCTRYFPFANGVPHRGYFMQWHQVVDAERSDDMDCKYGDMRALDHPEWGPALRQRPLKDAADRVLSGDKLESWRKTISHPIDDEFWAEVHFTDAQLAELDIPMFITDGWYDMTAGPIDYFARLEKLLPESGDRYLLVGPWNHYQTSSILSKPGEFDGDRTLPDNAVLDLLKLRLDFFGRYLKNDETINVQSDRVKIYITGSGKSAANRWFDFPTFPAPKTIVKKLYLHSNGDARTLSADSTLDWLPPAVEPADSYVYDPQVPTFFESQSAADRRHTEVRSDVLTYTSLPLTEPLTILGEVKLKLYAASDGLDTDWFATITEVSPTGESTSFHYAASAFRARYREGFDKEIMLTPNKPEEYTIPLGAAGHHIEAGYRIRLSIFSSAFPSYDPNSNTGATACEDTECRAARQTVYHDDIRPSHIILPVLPVLPSLKSKNANP